MTCCIKNIQGEKSGYLHQRGEHRLPCYFIVTQSEGIVMDCLHWGHDRGDMIKSEYHFKLKDQLRILNHCKYIHDVGWFVLVNINQTKQEFIFLKHLEAAINSEVLRRTVDVMLDFSIASFYVDQSLRERNRDSFMLHTTKLNELQKFKK